VQRGARLALAVRRGCAEGREAGAGHAEGLRGGARGWRWPCGGAAQIARRDHTEIAFCQLAAQLSMCFSTHCPGFTSAGILRQDGVKVDPIRPFVHVQAATEEDLRGPRRLAPMGQQLLAELNWDSWCARKSGTG